VLKVKLKEGRFNMGYDFLKQGSDNLKGIGFGAAVPEMRDRVLGAVSGDKDKEQEEKMKQMQAQIDASNKSKAPGMKRGGKVSSASARADGCCIRGKTRA
jgi:hypothetical protein